MMDGVFTAFEKRILNWIFEVGSNMLNWTSSITSNFWDFPLIKALMTFMDSILIMVFIASVAVALFDCVEEISADKIIQWPVVFTNFFKGFAFCIAVRYVCQYSMKLAYSITTLLAKGTGKNMTEYASTFSGIKSTAIGLGFIIGLLIILFITIGIVVFFISALRANGNMTVQYMSSPLYVTSIVRGDTSAIGDWLRQTVAIAVTYVVQYFLFVFGLVLIADYNTTSVTNGSFFTGIGFWMVLIAVPRVLNKFGMSSGSTGISGLTRTITSVKRVFTRG